MPDHAIEGLPQQILWINDAGWLRLAGAAPSDDYRPVRNVGDVPNARWIQIRVFSTFAEALAYSSALRHARGSRPMHILESTAIAGLGVAAVAEEDDTGWEGDGKITVIDDRHSFVEALAESADEMSAHDRLRLSSRLREALAAAGL